jgi:hypothetical protein
MGIQVLYLAVGLHLVLIPKKKGLGWVCDPYATQMVDLQGIVHKYKVISKYA